METKNINYEAPTLSMSSELALHLEGLVLQNQDVSQCTERGFLEVASDNLEPPKADAYTPLGDFYFYFSLILSKIWFGVRSMISVSLL